MVIHNTPLFIVSLVTYPEKFYRIQWYDLGNAADRHSF